MKIKLGLINFALVVYFIGLLCIISVGLGFGLALVIAASLIIAGLYFLQVYLLIRDKKLFSIDLLMYSLLVVVLTEIFIQGVSVSTDVGLNSFTEFYRFHIFIGFLLFCLFTWCSISLAQKIEEEKMRHFLLTGLVICSLVNFLGFLGFAGLFPVSGRLIFYVFVFQAFFNLIFFLFSSIQDRFNQPENKIGLLISSLMIIYWILRWRNPELISPGIYRVAVNMGFVMMVVLPISILLINKIHFLTTFVFYAILIDFYFISALKDFQYLVNVGANECIGYDQATDYPVVRNPGISVDELFKDPTETEINVILKDWKSKDFTPKQVRIEYAQRQANGDSLKVISHNVNGQKHYGMVRIPAGINTKEAPILLGLHGGGADIDVVESTFLNRMSSGICRDVLNKYISIAPAFRGDIARGEDFCFRAEGYTGDVWLGPAEDAVSFLEVVNAMYSRGDSTKVLAMGVSRGATVALVIGSLTDKLDYIISISTHTKLHDVGVFQNERVGRDYPRIFFTPQSSSEIIRQRLIASSPYYFAERLPNFEIHQGTADDRTTVYHAKLLEQRLLETGRNESTYKIYVYEGKGHAYDDDETVCARLNNFLEK